MYANLNENVSKFNQDQLKGLCARFRYFVGGKGDHRESENRTLNGNWTLLMVEISIFPTCSGVLNMYIFQGSVFKELQRRSKLATKTIKIYIVGT